MKDIFLTPSAPGKPGVLVELEFDEGPEKYLEPVSYAANDDIDVERAQKRVAAAEAALAHATESGLSAAKLARYNRALASAKSELAATLARQDGTLLGPGSLVPPGKQGIHFSEVVQSFVKSVAALSAPASTPPAPKKKAKLGSFDAWLDDWWAALQKKKLDQLIAGGGTAMAETKDSPVKGATHAVRNSLALQWDTFLRDPSLRPA